MIRYEMPEALVRQSVAAAGGCPVCGPTGDVTPVSQRLSCTTVPAITGASASSSSPEDEEQDASWRPVQELVTFDPAWAKLGQHWQMREADYRLQAELNAWLPSKIFDAHLHLWNFAYWGEKYAPNYAFLGHDGSIDAYKERIDLLYSGREVSGLVLPFPMKGLGSEGAMSSWAAEQSRKDEGLFVPSLLITPETTYADIAEGVGRFGYANLKPYHVFANKDGVVPSTGEASANTAYLHERFTARYTLYTIRTVYDVP
jgi:hypothetical protein